MMDMEGSSNGCSSGGPQSSRFAGGRGNESVDADSNLRELPQNDLIVGRLLTNFLGEGDFAGDGGGESGFEVGELKTKGRDGGGELGRKLMGGLSPPTVDGRGGV